MQKRTDELTVPIDDLEYLPEGVYLYQSVPFSGVALEKSDGGMLLCRMEFLDGREHGVAEDYFPTGQVSGRTQYHHGLRDGEETEWHANGQKKELRVFDQGRLTQERSWSEDGTLLEQRQAGRDPSLS